MPQTPTAYQLGMVLADRLDQLTRTRAALVVSPPERWRWQQTHNDSFPADLEVVPLAPGLLAFRRLTATPFVRMMEATLHGEVIARVDNRRDPAGAADDLHAQLMTALAQRISELQRLDAQLALAENGALS